jgi:F-type H+-transporting ATPase subunit delta
VSNIVAKVYADALFGVAFDRDTVDVVEEHLDYFVAVLDEHDDLRHVLVNPHVPEEAKHHILKDGVVEERPELENFLRVLVDEGRFPLVWQIRDAYRARVDELRNRIHVYVTSAKPLKDDERGRIEQIVERQLKGNPIMHVTVDPRLMGGLIIRIGDEVLDGSVATRMRTLHRQMHAAKLPQPLWAGDEMDRYLADVRKKVDAELGPR